MIIPLCMHQQERVPFQYLISSAHWRQYILSVGPGVLIPRPETEILPDLAADAIQRHPHLASLPWVDLGTGSGAVAIGLADALKRHNKVWKNCMLGRKCSEAHSTQCKPSHTINNIPLPSVANVQHALVLAVDISPVAAAYATANANASGLGKHVQVLQGSWYQPVQQFFKSLPTRSGTTAAGSNSAVGSSTQAGETGGLLGGILSNPPYIPTAVIQAGLQAEVARHEPMLALDGGEGQGLDSLQVCQGEH
jgi:release factor glutamine methyltransferase